MDAMYAIAAALFGAGLIMAAVATLSGSRHEKARVLSRLATVERKLDAIHTHLGIVEPEPEWPEIMALLQQDKKIQAVKLYREATGSDLLEAKTAVEEIARRRGL
jgi:ribosomal protein L7/L12